MFKIIVCGSRKIKDKEFVFKTLDFLLSKKDLSNVVIIQGGQQSYDKRLDFYFGADYFAKLWAEKRNVKCEEFPAPWKGLKDTPKSQLKTGPYGSYWPGAGAYRNKKMVEEKPNGCVAFFKLGSKNNGTKNMVSLCEKENINIKKYCI